MTPDQENQRRGSEKERLFCKLISRFSEVSKVIKDRYKILGVFEDAYSTGANLRKSDAIVVFSNNYSLGVNIKSGSVNFNQVVRVWLDKFINDVELSGTAEAAIQWGVDNHRLKRSDIFIEDKYQGELSLELQSRLKEIMEYIFAKNHMDFVKILALYDNKKKVFYLYDMQETIEKLCACDINFSKKGVIKFGDYLTMQRKGGDGGYRSLPRGHERHPGNQIQFKMKIISYMNEMEPFAILKG